MNSLPVPVISDAHYDRDNSRVVITVEPCNADYVNVWRTLGETPPTLVWCRHVEPCDAQQTFYDYTCPLNSTAEYAADSYLRAGDDDVIPHSTRSEPVTVSTVDDRGWTKIPCVHCQRLVWTPVHFTPAGMVLDVDRHRKICPGAVG